MFDTMKVRNRMEVENDVSGAIHRTMKLLLSRMSLVIDCVTQLTLALSHST